MSVFDRARAIADTVLYEGYLLYPYRASSGKNLPRARFQFGVVAPPAWDEPSRQQTEVLVDVAGDAVLDVRVRFLQLESRTVEQSDGFSPVERLEVDGTVHVTWDEGIARTVDVGGTRLSDLIDGLRVESFAVDGTERVERIVDAGGVLRGRIKIKRERLWGRLALSAERCGGFVRVRAVLTNETSTSVSLQSRDEALRLSFLGTHAMLAIGGGRFVSQVDPPPDAADAARACVSENAWPVLVDERCVLSSPIILYDFPQVAPESATQFHDATEIDEMLTLRVMTLTDEEKREVAGTDARARMILEQSDSIPREIFERLHGAVRSLGAPVVVDDVPSWGGFDADVDPHDDSVTVDGTDVGRGSRVRLQPRKGADAHDMFLVGRVGRVEGVFRDVDGTTHVAVTVEDDPAADMHAAVGRYLYFRTDEIVPIEAAREGSART